MIEGRQDRPERNHMVHQLCRAVKKLMSIFYWFGSGNALDTELTDSPAFDTEVINSSPQTCANIYFKSVVVDTPTPFVVSAGRIIEIEFVAKVNSIAGVRRINLKTQLFYVDADGVSNPVQVGNDSEETDLLITTEVIYQTHCHIPADVTIPSGKRLWVKFIATTITGVLNVTLSVEYDGATNGIRLPAGICSDF